MFIVINRIGLNRNFSGIDIIEKIISNILFIIDTIFTFIFIKYLLINIIYIKQPKNTPKNIYKRISPLLNVNIEYNNETPVKIQNNMSSKYVVISFVLKLFLNTLKISNKIPIKIPFMVYTKNK